MFKKAPKLEQLLPVYAVIVVLIYLWSLIHFFWKLPSWIYFLSAGEISVVLAYMIVINLVESLFILLLIIALKVVLSRIWPDDQFIVKGVLLTLVGLGFLIYRNHYFPTKAIYALTWLQLASVIGLGMLVILVPLNKVPAFSRAMDALADRFIIFLYIAIPASAISLLVVLFRNLF
jgi:hypothetical protein